MLYYVNTLIGSSQTNALLECPSRVLPQTLSCSLLFMHYKFIYLLEEEISDNVQKTLP